MNYNFLEVIGSMKKLFNIHASIYFYLVFGMSFILSMQLIKMNKASLIDDTSIKYTPVKKVSDDIRQAYSQDAISLYQEAALAEMPICDFVQEQLAQQEQLVWQEVETYTGVPHEELVEFKDDIKAYYLNPDRFHPTVSKALSNESVELARQALVDFEVSNNHIAFENGDNTLMQGGVLQINQREHLSVPPMVAKAIIGHEMMHYKFDDCFFLAVIQEYMKKKGESVNKCGSQHPYYKLRRFQEMRADIIPALKDLEYAKASVECLEIMMNKSGDCGGMSHPKTTDRLKEIQKIYGALEIEKIVNN